jgi:hypothetical protein
MGGRPSHGPHLTESDRRLAYYVDRILIIDAPIAAGALVVVLLVGVPLVRYGSLRPCETLRRVAGI